MASFTENLGLKKPDRTDRFSIEDFNGNMDIIDTIPDMASGQSLVGVSVGEAYAKWERMWSRGDNQEVGLEAAILERVRNSSLVK